MFQRLEQLACTGLQKMFDEVVDRPTVGVLQESVSAVQEAVNAVKEVRSAGMEVIGEVGGVIADVNHRLAGLTSRDAQQDKSQRTVLQSEVAKDDGGPQELQSTHHSDNLSSSPWRSNRVQIPADQSSSNPDRGGGDPFVTKGVKTLLEPPQPRLVEAAVPGLVGALMGAAIPVDMSRRSGFIAWLRNGAMGGVLGEVMGMGLGCGLSGPDVKVLYSLQEIPIQEASDVTSTGKDKLSFLSSSKTPTEQAESMFFDQKHNRIAVYNGDRLVRIFDAKFLGRDLVLISGVHTKTKDRNAYLARIAPDGATGEVVAMVDTYGRYGAVLDEQVNFVAMNGDGFNKDGIRVTVSRYTNARLVPTEVPTPVPTPTRAPVPTATRLPEVVTVSPDCLPAVNNNNPPSYEQAYDTFQIIGAIQGKTIVFADGGNLYIYDWNKKLLQTRSLSGLKTAFPNRQVVIVGGVPLTAYADGKRFNPTTEQGIMALLAVSEGPTGGNVRIIGQINQADGTCAALLSGHGSMGISNIGFGSDGKEVSITSAIDAVVVGVGSGPGGPNIFGGFELPKPEALRTPDVNPSAKIDIFQSEEFEGVAEGIKVNYVLGVTGDISRRQDRPIISLGLNTDYWSATNNREPAADKVAFAILRAHYFGYLEDHPATSWEKFKGKVKKGEDVSYEIAISKGESILEKDIVRVDPRRKLIILLTDEYFTNGIVAGRPKSSEFYGAASKFMLDEDGNLIILNYLASGYMNEVSKTASSGVSGIAVSRGLNLLGTPIGFQSGRLSEVQRLNYNNAHVVQSQELQDLFGKPGQRPVLRSREP